MRKVKIRSKRQLAARDASKEAVAKHRAARAGDSPPIRPPTPEEIERFSVGGGCGGNCQPTNCGPPMACRPSSLNDCYHVVAQKYGCPLKVASGGEVDVAALGRVSFRVEPSQSNYFLPIAVRLSARLRDDPTQLRVWRLTAVMVKNHPQENYHEPNPSATTVVGVESVAYDGRTAGEVPAYEVGWGPFSRSALAEHLELVGINLSPADIINPRAEIWGYPIDTLPIGWKCGEHPGRPPTPTSVTDQPGSGNGGGGGQPTPRPTPVP